MDGLQQSNKDRTTVSPATKNVGERNGQFPISYWWLLLPLAWLWFRLVSNLHLEWSTNPQYGFGELVPFICVGLLVRRWNSFRSNKSFPDDGDAIKSILTAVPLLAFLFLPTRLVEAATPEWRPVQWLLAVEVVGMTLCLVRLGWGRGWLHQLAFPICFFLTAVPWPSPVEQPIIQHLTGLSVILVTNILGWMGIPALIHGNVIEVSTGMVGVDEACSGIRSFQSSLMISLCLGEFYRLKTQRRLVLILIGFVCSLVFNIGRMTFLTVVAARKGVSAIGHYHDPAGETIAILCTLSLLGVALFMARSKSNGDDGLNTRSAAVTSPSCNSSFSALTIRRLGLSLLLWIVAVELGVYGWYNWRESHHVSTPDWTLQFPQNNPSLRDVAISLETRELLRYDEGRQASWTESDGSQWQAFYFNWLPGRVAGYLAKRHTPEACLVATGYKLLSGPQLTLLDVHGVKLPMRYYVFESGGQTVYVFQCRWEAGVDAGTYVNSDSTRLNLLRAIWTSRGNQGQKVVEFVAYGEPNQSRAADSLKRQLDEMVQTNSLTLP